MAVCSAREIRKGPYHLAPYSAAYSLEKLAKRPRAPCRPASEPRTRPRSAASHHLIHSPLPARSRPYARTHVHRTHARIHSAVRSARPWRCPHGGAVHICMNHDGAVGRAVATPLTPLRAIIVSIFFTEYELKFLNRNVKSRVQRVPRLGLVKHMRWCGRFASRHWQCVGVLIARLVYIDTSPSWEDGMRCANFTPPSLPTFHWSQRTRRWSLCKRVGRAGSALGSPRGDLGVLSKTILPQLMSALGGAWGHVSTGSSWPCSSRAVRAFTCRPAFS
jgi:hypothetical protein